MQKRSWSGGLAIAAVALLVVSCGARADRGARRDATKVAADTAAPISRKGTPMQQAQIVERIGRGDGSVISEVAPLGPGIARDIIPLASHADPEVRELALYCLNEAGGPEAPAVFAAALRDSVNAVRYRACLFLHRHHAPQQGPELRRLLRDEPDPYVRGELALILAEMGDGEAALLLRTRLPHEPDQDARDKYRLALARLGDGQERRDIYAALASDRVEERYRALGDFAYVGDRTQAARLLPLLDDERPAENVAPGGHARFVRLCDVTVRTLDALLAHPFPFRVEFTKEYSPEELRQAKAVLTPSR